MGSDALSDCMACAAGKYSVIHGSSSNTTCLHCVAGKYGVATGQTAEASCTACGAGKYGVATDSTCVSCPQNTVSPPASIALADCVCKSGFKVNQDNLCVVIADNVAATSVTSPVVEVSLSMPMSEADFRQQENAFISAISRSAGLSPAAVTIVSVKEIAGRRLLTGQRGRRLLAMSVAVLVRISTSQPGSVSEKLTETALNENLKAAGLPQVFLCGYFCTEFAHNWHTTV